MNEKYTYAKSKEVLETYIALMEEACSHIEELRLNSERLLNSIKNEMKIREEHNLDEIQSINEVLDFYASRSKALDKILVLYGW